MNTRLVVTPSTYITADAFENSSAKWIPRGALVVALAGQGKTKGMVAQVAFATTCNQSMAAIIPGPQVHPRFLFWWLDSSYQNIRNMAGGDLRDGLNLELLGDIPCPLPPLGEQIAIAALLDRETEKIDALVTEQHQLIALLSEKRQAIIFHAVTKGLNPNVRMKPSGVERLGEVPAHWDVVRLGRRIELQRGVDITKDQQAEGPVPVVSSGGIASFHDTALCDGPGVVIGRKGSAGSIYYIHGPYWPHDTTLYVRRFRGNSPRFVFYSLSSLDLESFDTGTANPTLNRNLVHPVSVAWPPVEAQAEIAVALDQQIGRLDALQDEAQSAIRLLYERRTALISAAVTGQIDVRGLAEVEVA